MAFERSQAEEYSILLQEGFRQAPDCVFVKNLDLQYVAASNFYAEVMGYSDGEELLGKTDRELFSDLEMAEHFESVDRKIIATGENLMNFQEECHEADSGIFYRSTTKVLLKNRQGEPIGVFGKVIDVTKEVIAEHRYKQEVEELFILGDRDCYCCLIDMNEEKLIRGKMNPFYGEKPPKTESARELIDRVLRCTEDSISEIDEFYSGFSYDYFRKLYRLGRDYFAFKYHHTLWNGNQLWMKDIFRLRINPENSHLMVLVSMQSIQERKLKELELHRAAEIDSLTGLMNRACAQTTVEKLLLENQNNMEYSMFMVDVDDFKTVNDTYGHIAGDKVLEFVAKVLRESFRQSDIVCRLGGDEFYAFVGRERENAATIQRAETILSRIEKECREYAGVQITVSMGICDYPRDGANLVELYASADKALYAAKGSGKNQFCLYEG